MTNSSSIGIQTDLYLTHSEKVLKVQAAVSAAAKYGYFSLRDIYRELGYMPSKSNRWNNKEKVFAPGLIHKTMKSMGVQSTGSKQGRAGTQRYFISPGSSAEPRRIEA